MTGEHCLNGRLRQRYMYFFEIQIQTHFGSRCLRLGWPSSCCSVFRRVGYKDLGVEQLQNQDTK